MKTILNICRGIIVVGLINLTVFILIAVVLGGDAVSGGASEGHYFLSAHGHRTEVSHITWIYSRVHFYTAMVSGPAVIAAGVAAGIIKKKYPAVVPNMPD